MTQVMVILRWLSRMAGSGSWQCTPMADILGRYSTLAGKSQNCQNLAALTQHDPDPLAHGLGRQVPGKLG